MMDHQDYKQTCVHARPFATGLVEYCREAARHNQTMIVPPECRPPCPWNAYRISRREEQLLLF